MKKLEVKINGKAYIVEVEILEDYPVDHSPIPFFNPALHRSENFQLRNPSPDRPAAFRPTTPKAGSAQNALESAVNGTVLEIKAEVGQTVAEGDLAFIVEAMKMKTNVFHAKAGKVKSIEIAVGDVIETGALMLSYE